jgi:hypothetical protein
MERFYNFKLTVPCQDGPRPVKDLSCVYTMYPRTRDFD